MSAIPELAVRLGADRAEGVALRLMFVGGGGGAIREILAGNAQFGVFGLTAAMRENLAGPRLVALAAVEDRAPLTLVVRNELKDSVRELADLRGRVIGVHSNSLSTTTHAQQLVALLLRRNGLAAADVRLAAAGQSLETQAAALRSRLVDCVVSEEPIGLRLEQAGLGFALLRLGLPERPVGLPGEGFLRGSLITTPELVARDPELAARLVRVVQRTLAWRHGHSPEEVTAALGLAGADAEAFAAMLRRYPNQFSRDGRFSDAQLEQTDLFFRESEGGAPPAAPVRAAAMLADRWAGRKP